MFDITTLQQVVRAGCLAPSGDNCQPWRFVWDGRTLRIHWLHDRAKSFYDVNRYASWIALGATLTNMRIAGAHYGFQLEPTLHLTQPSREAVAEITIRSAPPQHDPLFSTIERRCVNRRPYRRDPLPSDIRNDLMIVVGEQPGYSLELVETEKTKAVLAALAARNDRLLFEHRALHDGLYRWLRWTSTEARQTGDGLPIASLELRPIERFGFRMLGWWAIARGAALAHLTSALPLRTTHTYQHSAAIGLLSMDGYRPEDFVRAGEVLERLWLMVTRRALAFQPITGMICLLWRCRFASSEGLSPRHRRWIEQTIETLETFLPSLRQRTPVMLFRIGVAETPTARTYRRSLNEMLMIESV